MKQVRWRDGLLAGSICTGLGLVGIVGWKLLVQLRPVNIVMERKVPATEATRQQARDAGLLTEVTQSTFVPYHDLETKPVTVSDLRRIRALAAWLNFKLANVEGIVVCNSNSVFVHGKTILQAPVILHFQKLNQSWASQPLSEE